MLAGASWFPLTSHLPCGQAKRDANLGRGRPTGRPTDFIHLYFNTLLVNMHASVDAVWILVAFPCCQLRQDQTATFTARSRVAQRRLGHQRAQDPQSLRRRSLTDFSGVSG